MHFSLLQETESSWLSILISEFFLNDDINVKQPDDFIVEDKEPVVYKI